MDEDKNNSGDTSNRDNYSEVETVIGHMDTWACSLLQYSYIGCVLYVFYDFVVKNLGWIGWLLSIPFFIGMYCLPVIYVIQPLSKSEKESYLKYKSGQ